MKRSIKLAVVAALALGATSAFATNGTSLIGYGAKSRGMGGTGVAHFQGAESGFNNPALLSNAVGTEVSIGGTYFAPTVSNELNAGFGPAAGTYDSTASASLIPAVSMATKVNDSFAWGLALYGVGGMGTDYRDDIVGGQSNGTPGTGLGGSGLPAANDNLLLMRFSAPFAYNISGFSVGVAPVIEYGALAQNDMFGTPGITTDIAFGFEIGAAYDFKAVGVEGLSVGLDYKSAVEHDFKNSFASAAPGSTSVQSKLDTPSILVAGVSYSISGNTISFDYKNIGYADATGLKDFDWENQSVYALGYEYAADGWAARLGYNYGASPLPEVSSTFDNANQVVGSLLAFPAVTESHFTVGGTYDFSETTSLDAAFVYGTGSQTSTDVNPVGPGDQIITATNDQISATVAVNFNF